MTPSAKTPVVSRCLCVPRRGERGSTIVMVLLVVCVMSLVAGGLLFSSSARYHSTYQSASWQEALIGAEAGVDVALNELRQQVVAGVPAFSSTSWATQDAKGTPYLDKGRAFPSNNPQAPFLLRPVHGGEGNTMLATRIYVDVPGADKPPTPNNSFAQPPPASIDPFLNEQKDGLPANGTIRFWYRIRALGYAGVSGPTRANLDARDNRLRKFSFFTDWRTGLPVTATPGPNVSRLVEVVAKPLTSFRNAIMADKRIDLSNMDVLIDSYDSTKGDYSAVIPPPPASQNTPNMTAPGSATLPNGQPNPNVGHNIGWMGNIATNGLLINANGANVQGDAMTNDGSVSQGENVVGQQRADFYQDLPPVKPLTGWTSVPDDGTITNSKTYTVSTDRTNPTRVRLDNINLPTGGKKLLFTGPTAAPTGTAPTPSYVKVYVDGDIRTAGDSVIELADGVNAIFYVSGNINLIGHGIKNDSTLPGRLLINGIQPPANPDGSLPSRTITIGSDIDFEGIIYAPNHDLNLTLTVVPGSNATTTSSSQALADQIRRLQDDANQQMDEYNKQIADYNQKMADFQRSGDPSKLIDANKALAAANAAKATADADLAQIAVLQIPPAVLPGDPHVADHNAGYNGIYGAFAAKTVTVGAKTHVHYDEALREAGPVNHYEIVNWFEDQNSRATVNW